MFINYEKNKSQQLIKIISLLINQENYFLNVEMFAAFRNRNKYFQFPT